MPIASFGWNRPRSARAVTTVGFLPLKQCPIPSSCRAKSWKGRCVRRYIRVDVKRAKTSSSHFGNVPRSKPLMRLAALIVLPKNRPHPRVPCVRPTLNRTSHVCWDWIPPHRPCAMIVGYKLPDVFPPMSKTAFWLMTFSVKLWRPVLVPNVAKV